MLALLGLVFLFFSLRMGKLTPCRLAVFNFVFDFYRDSQFRVCLESPKMVGDIDRSASHPASKRS